MYKGILMTIVMLMCFGVFVQAEPLPLVPGKTTTAAATEQAEQTASAGTAETTAQTTGNTAAETTAKTASEQRESTQENIMEDTENEAAKTVSTGNANVISTVESRAASWFTTEHRGEDTVTPLANSLTTGGDYRAKAALGARLIKDVQEAVQGQAGTEDIRAAIDAHMGWDFNYGVY